MEPSPTSHVVLGMLALGPKSGYEIKALVDRSTRFFWAASYGQIYPELRRLAAAGLIEGADRPQGGRKRTVYELTPAGRSALRAWIEEPPETHELRDESLLKLFFADSGKAGARAALLAAKEEYHRGVAAELRAIEAEAGKDPKRCTYLVLRYGIDFNDWIADWCKRERRRSG